MAKRILIMEEDNGPLSEMIVFLMKNGTWRTKSEMARASVEKLYKEVKEAIEK